MAGIRTTLLRQFAGDSVSTAIELDQLFKCAGIPTEWVIYSDEAHVFWAPRHRASAMERNLDWFDSWLVDRRDPSEAKAAQYARWDGMAAVWRKPPSTAVMELPANPSP